MSPATTYALAAALTLVVEVPVDVACALGLRWARPGRAVLVAVAVNVVTHPVLYAVTLHRGWAPLLLAEALAVLVEAALMTWWWGVRRDRVAVVWVALAANAASFLLGGLVLAAVSPLASV